MIRKPPICLELNSARHSEVWRLAAYAVGNCLLAMQVRQLRLYAMRPLDLLIFNMVALACVQRSIRSVRMLDLNTDDINPTNELNGTTSRRRIAESSGLPRSTVARALSRLMSKGMVVERSRGRLQVPVGIVLQGPFSCEAEDLYAPVISMMEQWMRLGVVREAHDRTSRIEAVATARQQPFH
jgi:hypothetical protein